MISRSPKKLLRTKTLALLEKFEEWGRGHPHMSWRNVLRRLGPAYRLATRNLKPADEEAAHTLKKAKGAFQNGARTAGQHSLAPRSSPHESARGPPKAYSDPHRRRAAS